jgi:hypothetical protein
MYTTGIVSTRDGCQIALFLSGRQHAGENLKDVLLRRAVELASPIQMCDALSRNAPAELKTILANCLAHGRRQFVEVAERFPEECRHVLEALSVIYHNDAIAWQESLSAEDRLLFHQARSGPAIRRAAGGAELGVGRGHLLSAEALGEADAFLARGRRAVGQQYLRTGVEEGDSASQERLVLQDLSWRPRGRRLYEPDLHLSTLRGQGVRLPHGVGSPRGGACREPAGLDAVELPGEVQSPSSRRLAMSKRRVKKVVGKADSVERLRKALGKATKGELVDILVELARDDRDLFRQLGARFKLEVPAEELAAATRLAIADATDFD